MSIEHVANWFRLGRPTGLPVAVPGGLSNELWRLVTDRGEFAIKRMVVNADCPDFVRNVEAAFEVEWHAWSSGVAMPEPVPDPATAGWVAAQGGWLDYNAKHRANTSRGATEVANTRSRLGNSPARSISCWIGFASATRDGRARR